MLSPAQMMSLVADLKARALELAPASGAPEMERLTEEIREAMDRFRIASQGVVGHIHGSTPWKKLKDEQEKAQQALEGALLRALKGKG